MSLYGKITRMMFKHALNWGEYNAVRPNLTDGDVAPMQLGLTGGILVESSGGSMGIEGIVADDDPAGATKPVLVGAKYLVDIFDSALSASGDAAIFVTDQYRRLYVRSAAFDTVSNADRNVPVAFSFDHTEPFDIGGGATADLTSYYIDANSFPYWSCLFETATAAAIGTVVVYGSNQASQQDITLRNYESVHNELFGAASSTFQSGTPLWLIADTPIMLCSYKITVDFDNAATWTGEGEKGAI